MPLHVPDIGLTWFRSLSLVVPSASKSSDQTRPSAIRGAGTANVPMRPCIAPGLSAAPKCPDQSVDCAKGKGGAKDQESRGTVYALHWAFHVEGGFCMGVPQPHTSMRTSTCTHETKALWPRPWSCGDPATWRDGESGEHPRAAGSMSGRLRCVRSPEPRMPRHPRHRLDKMLTDLAWFGC